MIITGSVIETYNFTITLEKQEYEYAVALASGFGLSITDGMFRCLTSPAFISALNT